MEGRGNLCQELGDLKSSHLCHDNAPIRGVLVRSCEDSDGIHEGYPRNYKGCGALEVVWVGGGVLLMDAAFLFLATIQGIRVRIAQSLASVGFRFREFNALIPVIRVFKD